MRAGDGRVRLGARTGRVRSGEVEGVGPVGRAARGGDGERVAEALEVGEEATDLGGVEDDVGEAHASAAEPAAEDVEAERVAHERGPGGIVGAGAVGGLGNDGSAVLGVGGEDAVVERGVCPRPGDEGGQAGEEGADAHRDVGGSVGPGPFELDGDEVAAEDLQAVEGQRGSQEVTAEGLETGAVVGLDADLGVEVEAVEAGFAPGGEVQRAVLLGVRDLERVSYCNGPSAATLYTRVYGNAGSQNGYSLRAEVARDPSCCVDDRFEPDDTRAAARSVEFGATFEGTICPSNDDWIAVSMPSAGRLQASVTFDERASRISTRSRTSSRSTSPRPPRPRSPSARR